MADKTSEKYVEEPDDLLLRGPRRALAVPRGDEELGVLWTFPNGGPLQAAVRDDVSIPAYDDASGRLGSIDLFAMDLSVLRISGPQAMVVAALESMLQAAKEPLPFDPSFGIPVLQDDEDESEDDDGSEARRRRMAPSAEVEEYDRPSIP